jgi:hypothetical protein
LNKDLIYGIIQYLEIIRYPKGSIIYDIGNSPNYFYITLSGIVSIEIPDYYTIENSFGKYFNKRNYYKQLSKIKIKY